MFFAGRQIPQGVVIPGVAGDEGIEWRHGTETRSPYTICSSSTLRLLPLILLCSFGFEFCTYRQGRVNVECLLHLSPTVVSAMTLQVKWAEMKWARCGSVAIVCV